MSEPAPMPTRQRPPARGDSGFVLLATLLIGCFLGAVGIVVALVSDTDVVIGAAHRDGVVGQAAAEAVAAFVVAELAQAGDLTPALRGDQTSAFAGRRELPASAGGSAVDLAAWTASLQRQTYGSDPWGFDTPRWRAFAWGIPGLDLPVRGVSSDVFSVCWIADDVTDADGDPATDANGVVVLRVRTAGPGKARVDLQAVIGRVAPGIVQLLSWRILR